MKASFALRDMQAADLEGVRNLWQATPGICLSPADRPAALRHFLTRNPGLSVVATAPDGATIGAALCGHDGRRGVLYHVAVAPAARRAGVASAMIARCLDRLAALGIERCSVFVLADNQPGRTFWTRRGWRHREDLLVMQHATGEAQEEGPCAEPPCR